MDWFDSIRIDKIYKCNLWSDEWIPCEVDLKHIDESFEKIPEMQKSLDDEKNQNTKFDIEELRRAKTVGSNEIESKAISTVNEKENDFSSRSQRSKKIPSRYLN